jgi:hypothetical protein
MEAAVQLVRILLTCCALAVPAHGREAAWDWVPHVNERFGFNFRYPAGLFESQRRSEAGDGEVFVAGSEPPIASSTETFRAAIGRITLTTKNTL